jgi:translation initiation factor 2 beta subunit (eIF-2beta)/eIF-5
VADNTRKLMGRCTWCQEIRRVFEQEDGDRVVFLVCANCIKDVMQSYDRLQSYFKRLNEDDGPGSYFTGYKGA